MREIHSKAPRRKQKNKSGCCLGRFLVIVIIFGLLGYFGYRIAMEMGLKTYILQARYPIRYQTAVETYAKEFGLDEALVYAVILTESKFDTYAESNAGAKGLMQLTDETGYDCARKLGLAEFSAEQLFEPEVNIRLGCYYLNRLIREYDGITETAIAAYNGGPGNVDKWLRDPQYSPGDGTLHDIPFKETRDYVKKVTDAYWNYQSIYNLDGGETNNGEELNL